MPILRPNWLQFKVGPILRGEADWRIYAGQHKSPNDYLPRWRGLFVPRRKVLDPEIDGDTCVELTNTDYVFTDHRMMFRDLIPYRALVASRLAEITHDRVRQSVAAIDCHGLAVHIRLGDFCAIPGMASSLDWYARTVREVLCAFPQLAPAMVFSDADDADIRAVLEIPRVVRVSTGYALGDIWSLSHAKVLIASGNSSFSAWASFLSGAATLHETGHELRGFFCFDSAVDWIYDTGEAGSTAYLSRIEARLV